jgi:hypothetical protein|tara:strand:+ start:1883 stop:2149 length:267 start_codon:yes stop_codon:yes gene_type:complete
MNRDEIVKALRSGIARVTFTKVNGDVRVMDCTLKSDLIPESQRPATVPDDEGVLVTLDVIRVFDVKADGWRSFRVANVTNWIISDFGA